MCGLFGVIRPAGISTDTEEIFHALSAALVHRGPDGSGLLRDQKFLVGMHRLSIMDVQHGWQPFWSEDGQIAVLGNGEIYNAASLRHQLRDRGHALATGSDIEVVPHLYEEYGQEFVSHLRGMYALVIVDRRRNQLILVRDRMGEKPLCMYSDNSTTYFASEQTALVRAGIISADIENSLLPTYLLHGYSPEPLSLLRGVVKVPAASMVFIDLGSGEQRIERYWNPIDFIGGETLSDARLSEALTESIGLTCVSDVPVGLALSGGLDSSLIAAVASRGNIDLRAFTIGYEGGGADETAYASDLAAQLGIPISVSRLSTGDVAREFGSVCAMRDEPITDIAGPSLAALPRAAREASVPVLLTGVGGDELFWGYEWIRRLAQWSTVYAGGDPAPHDSTRDVLRERPKTLQGFADWLLGFGGRRMDRDMDQFMLQWSRPGNMPLPFYEFQHGYLRIKDDIRKLSPTEVSTRPEYLLDGNALSVASMYMIMSNETYLRVNSLVQMDRLSMQYSVESRTPFADANLVELMLSAALGNHDIFRGPKARLRDVAPAFLPPDVIARPKRGFTPPVREWLRAIWLANRDACQGEAIQQFTDLNATEVRRILRKPLTAIGQVDQMALRLLTLELWLRGLDSASPRTVTAS